MFGRESGGEDAEPAFGWPSGFRERRTNLAASGGAEPDTSAPSTSSPLFRQKPHLAAHRKSSDQVIQQLRDELDRQRQMFFDRLAPQWDQRAGFPFSDGVRRVFEDASERAAPQRPHHEDIPSWMTEDEHRPEPAFGRRQRWPSGGSGRSAASSASSASSAGGGPAPDGGGAADEPETGGSPGRPRIHKPATRSATGDFPPAAGPGSPKTFSRAGSAPPQPESAPGGPRRGFFVAPEPPADESGSPGARRRQSAAQHEQRTPGGGHVVRHIPIVVEGRDEPVLASVAEEEQQAAEKRSKTAIPMPFYAKPGEADAAAAAAAVAVAVASGTSAPKQARVNQREEARDGTIPIPLPYRDAERLSDGASGATPSSQPERHTAADLEQINRIQRETEALLPRVEAFSGDRHHRDFLYLDEMLTRLLLKLDNVQVEGREDVRQARRQAIASITRCINLLESRLLDSIDRSSQEHDASAPAPAEETPDAGREEEEQRGDVLPAVEAAPVAPPPVTHVTQLVINIGAPPGEGPDSGEPVQEVN